MLCSRCLLELQVENAGISIHKSKFQERLKLAGYILGTVSIHMTFRTTDLVII